VLKIKKKDMKRVLLFLVFLTLSGFMFKAQSQNSGFKLGGTEINYETATLVLSSVNATLTTLNLAGITPKWQSQYMQGVAIATGACQLGLGIWQIRSDFTSLNLVNITAGTATIITNSYLFYKTLTKGGTNTKKGGKGGGGKKGSTWNLYSAPTQLNYNKLEVGVRLTMSF
jgi:hypothetical protein